MKFLHMADVHLGCVPDGKAEWAGTRSRELWETFQESVEDAAKMKADLVLIAGDLFHTTPDLSMLREVGYLFSSFPELCFALIAGNHDCMSRGSAWQEFHFPENAALLGADGCECISFENIGCEVYGFSYDRPQISQPLYDGIHPDENDAFHILLAHGGDALHIPFSTLAMERSGFDYIALGHIHRPQIMVKDRAAYSGALSPIDAGDIGPHGYIVGQTSGHLVHLDFVPRAKREYAALTLPVSPEDTTLSLKARAADMIRKRGEENLYKITLAGQRRSDAHFDKETIAGAGLVLDVTDHTDAGMDIGQLRRDYQGQLIGRYIESFLDGGRREDDLTLVEKKALKAGLEALLL